MDQEVRTFIDAIGAVDLDPSNETHSFFKGLFKRHNYFTFKGGFMMVHLSRSKKPLWGIGKKFWTLFSDTVFNEFDFFLILLESGHSGWVFDRHDVKYYIETARWNLSKNDQYLINPPLPDKNSFLSHRQFLKMLSTQRLT
jgi:hypothetical protein